MRHTRPYLMIGLSIVAGLAAVLLGARWLASQSAMATTPVVVALHDIAPGSQLDASMLQQVAWPSASLPEGSLPEPAQLNDRVLRSGVVRGEPVVEAKLAPVGTKGGLSAVIGSGKRAITVKVNEVIGVAGFALPGNYVDVLVNVHDERDRPISKIVLERILVLAVAQEASRDDTKPKVVSAVTLEVDPAQAEKLDLARNIGSLSLALRNQSDKNPVQTVGVRQGDLLGATPIAAPAARPARARAAAPAHAPERVEVIRGLSRSPAEF